MLELFTSHGCSSCPPADVWLREYLDHPELWQQVIPLAFHVDYWDRLGWPDRFADPRYSQRQRDYQRSGQLRSVYTPGFVLRGSEWKGWFSGRAPDLSPSPEVGQLIADVDPGKQVSIEFLPTAEQGRDEFTAHLAILGFALTSEIGGGENAGRTLREEFVVLGMTSAKSMTQKGYSWELSWPDSGLYKPQRLAVAVWLSRPGNPAPVQAAGGWLP